MKAVPAVLTLVSDTDTLVLRPASASAFDPIVCSSWDLGAPAVRESSADRPGADGVIDRSAFTGGRSVTFDLHVLGDTVGGVDVSPYAYVERLAAMTHPGIRPRLRIQRASPEGAGQTWEMELRGNPYSLTYGRTAAAKLDMQLTFSAPLGYLLGDLQEVQGVQATAGGTVGYTFPITLPFSLGSFAPVNPVLTAVVGGSAPISPVIAIYGPVTNPEIRDELGQRFKFAGLVLDANTFVLIDMAAATVRLGGSPDASVYHLVDFSLSTFWQWNPGAHTVRYYATSGSVRVQWRDRRYSI